MNLRLQQTRLFRFARANSTITSVHQKQSVPKLKTLREVAASQTEIDPQQLIKAFQSSQSIIDSTQTFKRSSDIAKMRAEIAARRNQQTPAPARSADNLNRRWSTQPNSTGSPESQNRRVRKTFDGRPPSGWNERGPAGQNRAGARVRGQNQRHPAHTRGKAKPRWRPTKPKTEAVAREPSILDLPRVEMTTVLGQYQTGAMFRRISERREKAMAVKSSIPPGGPQLTSENQKEREAALRERAGDYTRFAYNTVDLSTITPLSPLDIAKNLVGANTSYTLQQRQETVDMLSKIFKV